MRTLTTQTGRLTIGLVLALVAATQAYAQHDIPGITGPSFNLTAGSAHIATPDGDGVLIWAYGAQGAPVQYPGPTLIVNQGDTVNILLTNNLSVPTSIVFPGQEGVTTVGGTPGLLTAEAAAAPPPTNFVVYTFVANEPGTYMYHSGTQPELQIEMGLLGAIIVRPTGYDAATNRIAYGHSDTAYDHEYLFLHSEMDPNIHDLVDFGFPNLVDNTTAFPLLWFFNGRNGLETLSPDNAAWMPNQPYTAFARTRPGERVLIRMIGGGRNMHSFHPHGQHATIIARDGRMLESTAGAGPDLATDDFTQTAIPGATQDSIFMWNGAKLGWDIYGPISTSCTDADNDGFDDVSGDLCHDANCPDADTNGLSDDALTEDCNDHGIPMPVTLPGLQDVTLGGWHSGSPFLGQFGALPPGEGGLNINGGLFFMWHSHNEKELANNDVFPGGMLSFVVIEPPGVPIP